MRSIEQITQDFMALPSDSRALLADKIVESLEFDVNGEITPIDGDDALAQCQAT